MGNEPIVRAISIRQPYVEQILRGEKTVEYRSRATRIRERVYLYASLTPGDEEEWESLGMSPGDLPVGVIVGSVEIAGCNGDDGNYEYDLAKPRRLPKPLRASNQPQPGFWRPIVTDQPPPVVEYRSKIELKVPAAKHGPARAHGLLRVKASSSEPLLKHQELAVVAMRDWLGEPASRPAGYVEMPTGSGKTFTAVSALVPAVEAGQAILWIAHNAYLLEQARKTFVRRCGAGVEPRMMTFAGVAKPMNAQITLATVQTLAGSELRNLTSLVTNNRPVVAVFDEFHRSAATTWKSVVDWLKASHVPVIGLSATPTRSSDAKKRWLEEAFPRRLFRVGISELVADRVLARPEVFRVSVKGKKLRWSDEEIAHFKRFHDLPESLLKRIATQEERNKTIIAAITGSKELGQAILFCCSVDHAANLAKQLQKKGITARAVTGSAADPENAAALDEFRARKIRVLTSVVLLTEGVDLPTCDTVLLGRPTQSEILLKQMIGRAMRGPKVKGNERCTIIDFVDAFDNASDVSGTSQGWMDVANPALTPILKKREGVELATLLRLRDWLAQELPAGDPKELLIEEIQGVLEFFDEGASMSRAVLVPRKDAANFAVAVGEVVTRLKAAPEMAADPVSVAVQVRDVYSKNLGGSRVGEEDFVTVLTAAGRRGDVQLRPVESLLPQLAKASVLSLDVVSRIDGIERLHKMLLDASGGAPSAAGPDDAKGQAGKQRPARLVESKTARSGTKKEQLTREALRLIASEKEGIRYSELVHRLEALFPDEEPGSGNFRSSIWDLDKRFPEEVYRPSRGLFRHMRFRAPTARQPPTAPDPLRAAGRAANPKPQRAEASRRATAKPPAKPTPSHSGHPDGRFRCEAATFRVEGGKLAWVKLKGRPAPDITTFTGLCAALRIPVGGDSAARVILRRSRAT